MKIEKKLAKKFFSPFRLILIVGALLGASLLFSLWMMKEDGLTLSKTVETSGGKIHYVESKGAKDCIVFLQGDSPFKEVFIKQFKGLGEKYKLIAFDLALLEF